MIDFHSHILPNIDDGAKSVEETFNLIKEANKAGFTGIISTSHYFEGRYEIEEKERKTWVDAISNNLKNQALDTKLYLGSEIFITNNIVNLIEEKKISTINNTRYLLLELPFEYKPSNLKNLILKLRSNKYRPIVAHPERYTYVQENPNTLIELIDMGVLFQSNYGSIIGIYGKKAKKTVEVLLKNNFVHFLGSDVHREKTIYTEMPEILKRMKHIIPDEQLDELTTLNAKLVLSDEDIDVRRPIKAKRALLNKFI